jgi:hypothetical protein
MALADILDGCRPRMSGGGFGRAVIDRDAADLGGGKHVTHGARAEGGDAFCDQARAERRREVRRPPEILGEYACLLLGSTRHLPEQRGVGGIGLGSGDRTGKVGGGLLRTPALQRAAADRHAIIFTLPVAMS